LAKDFRAVLDFISAELVDEEEAFLLEPVIQLLDIESLDGVASLSDDPKPCFS